MRLQQAAYDRLAAAARREWDRTPAGPQKLVEARRSIDKLLDGMELAPSERERFVSSMVEQLVGNPSIDAAYFGQRSSEFTLGDHEVFSADRPLWAWRGNRPSAEANAVNAVLAQINTGLEHEGRLRGLSRIELRQPEPPRPGVVFTRETPDGPNFDGTKRFEVVAISTSYQSETLGHVNLQPLLLKTNNPAQWTSDERDAFRRDSRAEIMKLVATLPMDPNYRPAPVDDD